jgi:8-oxo-dGTP diphosphatase
VKKRAGRASKTKSRELALRAPDPGTSRPPESGAPPPVYPISVNVRQRALAPVPINDRFPFVIGQSLTASYVSSAFRLCTTGYRLQYVDLLNELLEQDAHLFSVLTKRIFSTANGRLEIEPAKLPKDHKDTEKAAELAEYVQQEVDRIPDLAQNLAALVWAIYTGLAASEIFWTKDSDGWHVDRLGFIHSRRLAYPDYQSWDLYVWDQGQVLGWESPWGTSPTNTGVFGLRIADYPGKFIVHAPQLRGDYPTRDGIGREVAIWALFKRIGARGASSYLERFAKGFMDVSYVTGKDGKAREASKEDINLAIQIASSIGAGSGSYAAHADSIVIAPKSFDGGTGTKLKWQDWIGLCDSQESKAVLGGTLGTEVGKGGGNRALGEVQERGEVDLEQYDATTVAATLKRDLITWIVRLNRPECLHLVPNVVIHVDTDPDPKPLLEAANMMTSMGLPVDGDALSEKVGIALVPNEDKDEKGNPKPRRTFKSDVADPFQVHDDLMSPEAKQEKQDETDHKRDLQMAKAKQPVLAPGAAGVGALAGARTKPPAGGAKSGAGGAAGGKKPAPAKAPAQKGSKTLSERETVGEASIVLVRDEEGRFACVTRPEPPHELAFPGGHIDPGESPAEAASRELFEETGIHASRLREIGTTESPIDGRTVHVFEAQRWSGPGQAIEPATTFAWLSAEELYRQSALYRQTVLELLVEELPDQGPSAANLALREALLLSDRPDRNVAKEVFDQLLEDYPRNTLAWVLAAHWSGPKEIPTEEVDTASRKSWRASHEDVTPYVKRIEGGKRKPIVLVQTPANPKLVIVDGHHRFLAHEELGWDVLAYVAKVHSDVGPWDELHDSQKKGSSKGTASWLKKNT